ncbi:BTAD domain-containing putative transcriptional regulator [Gordonia sp. 852002-10350_SCH5691597]|uniref:BTAD domain-containing putative transcriptional regulator n=1 Tax=Gordonia sp. 852002-10350_SCH5691597 TaxID=1834085 RepID=UPI0007E9E2A5|nr:BTAD domain-containing putative transcriptional regulator [Gordonia sp. 852002-10350_SCH5691597]OBA65132.1 transcriptional regulator [Gordonia sp. 852002-10350_SCH5691597]
MSAPATTVIGLLGPVAAGVSAAPDSPLTPDDLVAVPGIRAKRLLASLALAGGRTRSTERLIDDVWGDDPPRSPGAALHTQISRLRGVLGAGRIEASGSGYRLVGARTDIEIVDDLIARGTATALDDAASWWRGDPGDDLGDEAAPLIGEIRARAGHVEDTLNRARSTVAMNAGDYTTARELAEERCARDPLDETAALDLMRALAGEGRIADALAVYAALRRRLSTELGVDPGSTITEFHNALLAEGELDIRRPAPSPRRSSMQAGLLVETSDLIGREGDVASILEHLKANRVVTIQGPGGVGKTRVANRVGHRLVDEGSSVYYVPLAPIRNDDDVVPAIAATLGVGESDLGTNARPRIAPTGDLQDRSQDRLIDALRGRDALLILDNCEQVIERCARPVADLLAADSSLKILVTSRSPLMLPAEQIFGLPTLDVTDDGAAVELFVTRARAVRPDADLPHEPVARLCRHLDGLPLAIELAAARIRTMTVEEITDRLAERFALLRGTDRSAPDRHRTLRAVIDWSWDLLDDDAREALRRLCRFPAGFTVDAAGIVLGYRGFRLDDTLASLVNQSLLTVIEADGRVRYRMLEMVREFGEEKLVAEPGLSSEVNSAMREWGRSVASEAVAGYESGVDAGLMTRVATDVDNLVWVLRHCMQVIAHREKNESEAADAIDCAVRIFPILAGFWMARGLHAEIMNWGSRLIEVLPTPPRDLSDERRRDWEATVLASMTHQMMRQDLRELARARYYLRRLHNPSRIYLEPTELMTACVLSRSPTEAIRYIVRGTQSSDERVVTTALGGRMNLAENLGRLDKAERDGRTLQQRSRLESDHWMSAMAQVSLGGIHSQQAKWSAAVDFYRGGIADLVRLGSYEDEMQTRCYLAVTLINIDQLDAADEELERVADGWTPDDPDPRGFPEVFAGMMLAMGELRFARGDLDDATALFVRAADLLLREHPMAARDPGASMLIGVAAVGLVRSGRVDRARALLPILATSIAETLSPGGWNDIPQAANMSVAAGYVLCDRSQTRRDGARLLMLGKRLKARVDYPGYYAVLTDLVGASKLTQDEWDAATADIPGMSRRRATEELVELLASKASRQA